MLRIIMLRPSGDCIFYCFSNVIISQYLKSLGKNEFTMKDAQSFSKKIRNFPPLENVEDISYDVESLFTNIPVKETVNCILDQIYVHKALPQICSRLIFKRYSETSNRSNFHFQ